MSRPRMFDHEEARRRRKAGETYAGIAASYGVSAQSVRMACDERARRLAFEALFGRVCAECRGPATHNPYIKGRKPASGGRILCRKCWAKTRRTGLQTTEAGLLVAVLCMTCRRWFDPDDYPFGSRYRDLRAGGFHSNCSDCGTKARRNYRDRHKVPCSWCGTPCLPPSEKGPRGASFPQCGPCFHKNRVAKHTEAVA